MLVFCSPAYVVDFRGGDQRFSQTGLNAPGKSCALRVSQSIPAIDNQAASGVAYWPTAHAFDQTTEPGSGSCYVVYRGRRRRSVLARARLTQRRQAIDIGEEGVDLSWVEGEIRHGRMSRHDAFGQSLSQRLDGIAL